MWLARRDRSCVLILARFACEDRSAEWPDHHVLTSRSHARRKDLVTYGANPVRIKWVMPFSPQQIVLDANTLISDYWLRKPSALLLEAFLRRIKGKLIIPHIIIKEV